MPGSVNLEMLVARESAQVEWKEDVADWRDVVKACVAFANDVRNLGGGYVVCGAAERRDEYGFPRVELVGMKASRQQEIHGKVLSACLNDVSPPLSPLVEELLTGDPARRVLIFIIPASRHAHSYQQEPRTSNNYFIRQDDRTVVAQNGLLLDLLAQKGALAPWDEREAPRTRVADVDPLAVRSALQEIGAWDSQRSIEQFLSDPISPLAPVLARRESLTGELRPTYAALLMFGSHPQRPGQVPSAAVIFSVYPGIDRSEPHAERHELIGTIFEQARRLRELLATQNYGVTDKASAAPNFSKYPEKALQEAVINALVHRDYEDREPVRVTVFADRLEIRSPGGLPGKIEVEEFRRGRAAPRWRNRSLAFYFNRLQLAQAEGQGIPTILRAMRSGGSPDPEFLVEPHSVTCVLPAHPRHAVMRELVEVERELTLGDYAVVEEKLRRLLARDVYNERALELFCDVCVLQRRSAALVAWIRQVDLDVERLSAATQVAMAEALSGGTTRPSDAAQALVVRLQALASQGHLQEPQAVRLVASLRRLEQDEQALVLVERLMSKDPALRGSSTLWRHRGEGHIDLSKRCAQTLRSKVSPRLKQRARREREEHLAAAEHDLRTALELVRSDPEREPVMKGLEFLARLRRS